MLERVQRKGNPPHCWWECKFLQPLWKRVWRFSRKLNLELPHDPATPLLGLYPDKDMGLREKEFKPEAALDLIGDPYVPVRIWWTEL